MDIATILSSLTGIQQTIEIAKALRGVDARLNDAEYKARIADLIDGLLSAREALSDAKMSIQDLKETISQLEKKLADRGRFRDSNGFLFEIDGNGNDLGAPFCNQCYVDEGKLFRLVYGPYVGGSHKCVNCKNAFSAARDSDGRRLQGYDPASLYGPAGSSYD